VIANEYPEASGELHIAALASVGLALFLVSVVINGLARWIVWRMARNQGGAR
jgi:phosphate transport system permease protein